MRKNQRVRTVSFWERNVSFRKVLKTFYMNDPYVTPLTANIIDFFIAITSVSF